MKLSWAGLKHIGNKRNHQEDELMMEGAHGVFAVFDGMGGQSTGYDASRLCAAVMAVDVRLGELERGGGLARLIHRCEEELRPERIRLHNPSVSTTVAALWLREDGTLEIAHVGDSRVYRGRAGALDTLTEDHSLLNEYRKTHSLTQEQIDNFPHKNVITRILGMNNTPVDVDISRDTWRPNDVYIICTDGLFTDDEGLIERVLRAEGAAPAAQLAQALMGAALAGAASDNIALVVVVIDA